MTRLIGWHEATPYERKKHGAEVVFIRQDERKRKIKIYGCKCYESWEQWGAITEVLADNTPTIERWRRGELE